LFFDILFGLNTKYDALNRPAISKPNPEFSVAILQQLNQKTLIYCKLHSLPIMPVFPFRNIAQFT